VIQAPPGLVRRSFAGVRRLWWPLLATDLVVKVIILGLFVPLMAVALRLFLSLGGAGGVLADEDILFFVLSPVGLLAVGVMGSLALALYFVEYTTLVVVVLLGSERDRVRPMEAVLAVLGRLGRLMRLGYIFLRWVFLLALPFAAVVGWTAYRLLSEHDINFYLAIQPREWWIAIWVAGACGALFGLMVMRKAATWFFAIPHLLTSDMSPGAAISASREQVAGRVWTVLGLLVAWLGASIIAGAAVTASVGGLARAGSWILPDSIPVVAAWLSVVLALSMVANLLVTWFSGSFLAVMSTEVFRAWDPTADRRLSEWAARGETAGRDHDWVTIPRIPGRVLLVGMAVVVVGAGVGLRSVLQTLEYRDEVQIIAHRGSSLAAPENTLAAVELAIQEGSDWIEIDVQETADGRVVVAHDRDLMKVAGAPFQIGRSTYEELAEFDIGSWFGPEFGDERLPLLEEVLEMARGRAGVLVELKYYGQEEALERRVVEIVERLGVEDSTEYMSLKLGGAQALKDLRPDWTVGLLSAVTVGDLTRQAGVDFLAVNSGIATLPFIRRAHASGRDVFVWTINDPVQMSILISKGVDGLITDVPALARQVMEERAELNGLERLLFLLSYSLGILPGDPPSGVTEA